MPSPHLFHPALPRCIYCPPAGMVMNPHACFIPSTMQLQPNPVAPAVGFHNGVKPGFQFAGVYYPTFQPPQQEALQKRERRLIKIQDPDEDNRDITAEILGGRTTSPLTQPHSGEVQSSSVDVAPAADVLPHDQQLVTFISDAPSSAPLAPTENKESDVVEAPAPVTTTPPQEAEPTTAPVAEVKSEKEKTRSQEKPHKRVRFCLTQIEAEQEEEQKVNKPVVKKSQDEQVKPPAPVEPASAPLPSSAPLALPELKWSDIVEASLPLTTTPPQEAEPTTAPVAEVKSELEKTRQSGQKRRKRTGQLLFCIPPMEEVQQKQAEKARKSAGKEENKTRSQEKRRRRQGQLLFCVPPIEEDQQPVTFTFISDAPSSAPLAPTENIESDVVQVPVPPKTTPSQEAEPTTSPVAEVKSELEKEKHHRRPGQLLFGIPPIEEDQQPVTFISDAPSSAPLALPELKWSDIVEASLPLTTTPPQEAEPTTAPVAEVKSELEKTCQSGQKRRKRTGQLLFCIPPMEEVQQKQAEKARKSAGKEENKTRSQEKRHRRPGQLLFCVPPIEEDQQPFTFTFISDGPSSAPLAPTENKESDVVEASTPLKTTPPQEAEPTTAPVAEVKSELEKTRSQEKPHKRVRFCLTQIEAEQEEEEKVNKPVVKKSQDEQVKPPAPVEPASAPLPSSAPLALPELKWSDIVEASLPLTTTPPQEAEPTTAPVAEVKSELEKTRYQEKPHKQVRFCLTPIEQEQEEAERACKMTRLVEPSAASPAVSDPETVLDLLPSSTPLASAEPKQTEIMKAPVPLPKDEMNTTPVRLGLRLRRVGQVQTAQEADMAKTPELSRLVRSMLDKTSETFDSILSAQNFQKEMEKITELPINTEERLKGVMEIVYDKVVSALRQSIICAEVCHHLKNVELPASEILEAKMTFQKILLSHCMDLFEKDFEQTQEQEEDQQHPKAEVEEVKERARWLGNTMILCELFKRKMVTEQVMHDCISKLLKNPSEDNLDHFCCLMCNIDKDLDVEMAKPCMKQYFQQIHAITHKHNEEEEQLPKIQRNNQPQSNSCRGGLKKFPANDDNNKADGQTGRSAKRRPRSRMLKNRQIRRKQQ
ncbi:hypothetical protein PGIGA_G00116960 [Pangasianodon gigas]|uniref:Uncharacterized protein n=1 Tax=Pangasianodon gigas TaxID=30993 RepID=A0ACC5XF56_PANGG|nr:hypothetical protein [Pangasianodon gigas]